MSPRLSFAIDAAKKAGKSTLELFYGSRVFDLKDNLTPVTEADRGAEHIVRKLIEEEFAGESVLGEELGGDLGVPNRWVVDPIDGTKSFIAGVPLFGTLLSFERDFEPVLGVAYFPALDEIVYAEVGAGAFWNGNPCHVSNKSTLSTSTICSGGHASMEKAGKTAGLLKVSSQAMTTRTWCDAYGHMLVATGRAEAMLDPIVSRWDISAMAVIVREAGGRFTDFKGVDTIGDEAVSCTPELLSPILEAFRT